MTGPSASDAGRSGAPGAARIPPPGLRDRVLRAALAARPPGRSTPPVTPIPPLEAFSRTADSLDALLSQLTDDEWHVPVVRDLDVQGLVGHLIGVEDDVQRCLAADPEMADVDHVTSTQPTALLHRGLPPAQTHRQWRQAVSATKRVVAGTDVAGPDIGLYGMRLPPADLLVVRAFELWTHENDIRRATGRPDAVPDRSTLALMTGLASAILPIGADRVGLSTPVALRLVLTGPGGGTWTMRLGPHQPDDAAPQGTGPAEITLVTDAVDFCRLVSRRIDPGDLDVSVTGQTSVADGVLAAAAALALD